MIHQAPSPLSQARLSRIIRGLQIRASSSARQLAEEVERLQAKIQQTESEKSSALQQHALGFRTQRIESTTQWDETLCGGWDKSEREAFEAIELASRKRVSLQTNAKSELSATVKESERRHQEAEASFGRTFRLLERP